MNDNIITITETDPEAVSFDRPQILTAIIEKPHSIQQNTKKAESSITTNRNDELCGLGSACHPLWLQWLQKPSILTFHFSILAIFVFLENPYFGAILSTIERQFGLDSLQSVLLSKLEDVPFLLVCIPIPYIAGKTNRPLWLFFCVFVMAIGNFISTLSHFLSKPFDPESLILGIRQTDIEDSGSNLDGHLCHDARLNQSDNLQDTFGHCGKQTTGLGGSSIWIVIGQLWIGVGKGGYYAIYIAYLYDVLGRDSHRLITHSCKYSTNL